MLTHENKLWLEQVASNLGTKPDSILNGLLRQIRTELGIDADSKVFERWLERSKHLEEDVEDTIVNANKALRNVEETSKAIQLYLNQLNNNIEK